LDAPLRDEERLLEAARQIDSPGDRPRSWADACGIMQTILRGDLGATHVLGTS